VQSTLLSSDAAYWRMCKDYIKPGDKPLGFQNKTEFGLAPTIAGCALTTSSIRASR